MVATVNISNKRTPQFFVKMKVHPQSTCQYINAPSLTDPDHVDPDPTLSLSVTESWIRYQSQIQQEDKILLEI